MTRKCLATRRDAMHKHGQAVVDARNSLNTNGIKNGKGESMARLKKIEAMHYFYGFDHLCRKCVECDHLIHGEYNGK